MKSKPTINPTYLLSFLLWLGFLIPGAWGQTGQTQEAPLNLILEPTDDLPVLGPESEVETDPQPLQPISKRPVPAAVNQALPVPARSSSAPPQPVSRRSSPVPSQAQSKPAGVEHIAENVDANQLLAALAARSGLQFFPNEALNDVKVTARLRISDPRRTITDIANSYGWMAYDNGTTLYVRTLEQMRSLPTRTISYPLVYLRQADVEGLLGPLLTPGLGVAKVDPKTNTVLIRDNDFALRAIEDFLRQIDRPKKSINIQTVIYRITDSGDLRYGIDWASTLGGAGYPISFGVANSLDMIFNMASPPGTFFTAPTAAILRPGALQFVTRALNETLNVETVNNPNLILEDNEEGTVSLVDRFPIIEFQPATNQANGANFISLSSTVRYRIDESDPVPTNTDPGRQLGVSLKVRPTILENGLVRMAITPRSADISELISVPTGENTPPNQVPRVTETSTTTTVSIKPGSTVIIGGFTQRENREEENKVPVLGDIPLVGTLFKDRVVRSIKSRVVFAVTPTLFNPLEASQVARSNDAVLAPRAEAISTAYHGDVPVPLEKQRRVTKPRP